VTHFKDEHGDYVVVSIVAEEPPASGGNVGKIKEVVDKSIDESTKDTRAIIIQGLRNQLGAKINEERRKSIVDSDNKQEEEANESEE
jgi:hypothetical protein